MSVASRKTPSVPGQPKKRGPKPKPKGDADSTTAPVDAETGGTSATNAAKTDKSKSEVTTPKVVNKYEKPGFAAALLPPKHTYKRTPLPYIEAPIEERRVKAKLLMDAKENIALIGKQKLLNQPLTSGTKVDQALAAVLPKTIFSKSLCWTNIPGTVKAKILV